MQQFDRSKFFLNCCRTFFGNSSAFDSLLTKAGPSAIVASISEADDADLIGVDDDLPSIFARQVINASKHPCPDLHTVENILLALLNVDVNNDGRVAVHRKYQRSAIYPFLSFLCLNRVWRNTRTSFFDKRSISALSLYLTMKI